MGQSGSKPPGSLPFGYVAYMDTSINNNNNKQEKEEEVKEKEEKIEKDRLLVVPHQYGLMKQNNNNLHTHHQYRPYTPPSPPTPLSFNLSTSTSSSSSTSFSLSTHIDNNNNKNDISNEMPPSHWMTLMNDVTYIDSTYYQKNITPYNPSDDHTTGNPLPPLPPFTMTEKILTSADLQTIDKTMHVISLSQQNLIRLSPSIGLFTRICKLDLSNNKLSSIPTTIGYLYQLEALYLGNNQLDSLPDTIGYLTKLVELDVSHNQLTTLTPCMAYLKKLQALTVAHNQLQDLPVHLVIGLKGLTILDLSHNPITILPAEITQLHFLRRLLLEGCPLMDPDSTNIKPPCYPLVHSPPSLLEYCARTIVRDTKRHQYYQQRFPQLSDHLIEYLNSGTPCTLCHAPYFDTYVARGRLVERSNRWIPVEYRLCQAHFTDETNRLLYMFSSSSSSPSLDHTLTSSSPSSISSTFSWHRPYRPPLPQLPNKIKRKSIYNHSITTDSISTITETTTTAVMMESVIQQQQQQQQQLLMQDDTRMDPINNNGWRAHRMKVMNKNQSGFLSLTKLPSNGNRQSDDPQQQQQL